MCWKHGAAAKDLLENYNYLLRDELLANSASIEEQLRELKTFNVELLQYISEESIEKDVIEIADFAAKHCNLLARIKSRTVGTPALHQTPSAPSQVPKSNVVKIAVFTCAKVWRTSN